MKNFLFLLAAVAFVFTACNDDLELKSGNAESLAGSWVSPVYEDSIYTFIRAEALKENEYGLTLKSNNQLVERKNAGWCGTPPIAYSDFTGNWTITDSTLYISTMFWGGTAHYQWKLISVDSQKLVVERIKEDYIFNE